MPVVAFTSLRCTTSSLHSGQHSGMTTILPLRSVVSTEARNRRTLVCTDCCNDALPLHQPTLCNRVQVERSRWAVSFPHGLGQRRTFTRQSNRYTLLLPSSLSKGLVYCPLHSISTFGFRPRLDATLRPTREASDRCALLSKCLPPCRCSIPTAHRRPRPTLRRVVRVPHRSLPGQGDDAEPSGIALLQHHVRAHLEPRLYPKRDVHVQGELWDGGTRRLLRQVGVPSAYLQYSFLAVAGNPFFIRTVDFYAHGGHAQSCTKGFA